jgi:hypothetical protein
MIRSLKVKRHPAMFRALSTFIAEVHLMDFPGNWHMLKEFLEGRLLKISPNTRRSFFCAELIAESYVRMGLLSKATPSNAYLPKDFAPGRPLVLRQNAKLGAGVLINV